MHELSNIIRLRLQQHEDSNLTPMIYIYYIYYIYIYNYNLKYKELNYLRSDFCFLQQIDALNFSDALHELTAACWVKLL